MDQILFVARDRSCASRSGDGQDLLRTICAFFKARKQAKFADGLLVVGLNHEKVSEVFKAVGFVADPSLGMGPQTLVAAAPPPWSPSWSPVGYREMVYSGGGAKQLLYRGCAVSPFAHIKFEQLEGLDQEVTVRLAQDLDDAARSIALTSGRAISSLRVESADATAAVRWFGESTRLKGSDFLESLATCATNGTSFLALVDDRDDILGCIAYASYTAGQGKAKAISSCRIVACPALAVAESYESLGESFVVLRRTPVITNAFVELPPVR
jgi:hypothetical protein